MKEKKVERKKKKKTPPERVCSQGSASPRRWMEECELSCLTSPWRPPERRQADRRQGSDEWVTSPRWRLPVCSGLFGQSGRRTGGGGGGTRRCDLCVQKHVKESAALTHFPSAYKKSFLWGEREFWVQLQGFILKCILKVLIKNYISMK